MSGPRGAGRSSRMVAGVAACLAGAALLVQAPTQARAPSHVEPGSLPRGADPAVAYLVHDTIRDGSATIPATTRGRHEGLWVVDGGYVVRDVNVGPRHVVRVVFISANGARREVARSPQWIGVQTSATGRRLAIHRTTASGLRSVITVERPRSGRILAHRELRLANLVAVTDTRVLIGRRLRWHHPATVWWNYALHRTHRIAHQAAIGADVRHDRVVFNTSSVGEFCNRVALLSHPRRTLWRGCRLIPHQWSPNGRHALATRTYFDAAGTDRWWVLPARTPQPVARVVGRLGWNAVWEDDRHFLVDAQGDSGQAAVLRCDLAGTCERASRLWDLPIEPDTYYHAPPVILADR